MTAPTYVQPVMTEAQCETLKEMVRTKIAEMGVDAPDFEDYVRLLGALCSPPKVKTAA